MRNLRVNINKSLKNEKFTPRAPLEARTLRPNTNRPLKNEKFTPRGPIDRAIYIQTQTGHSKMRNLCQRDHLTMQFTSKHQQATQQWEIYTKGTTWLSNLCPNTNKPLKNEHLYQRHNYSYMTHTNTQPHKVCKNKHTRFMQTWKIQNINTLDSHKKKNKKTQKMRIKHQTNMWSQKITKRMNTTT